MTIFESLRVDHDVQRELLDQLVDTSGDTTERQTVYKKLKQSLSDHAAAEERHFYIPLLENDMTQEKSRHSIAEHHDIDEFIEKLNETDMSSSSWLKTAKDLQHKVLHHLEEEEREVFQIAGKVLTDNQKSQLAEDYKIEMNHH